MSEINVKMASVGDTNDTLNTKLEIFQHIVEGDIGRRDNV